MTTSTSVAVPFPRVRKRRWMARLEPLVWLPMIVYMALFGSNVLTRFHTLTRDAMNYVQVGESIALGQGITQPTVGYNEVDLPADFSVRPVPFTAQPPLYPMLIAALHLTGLDFADAALVIGIACYALVIAFAALIARAAYGVAAGMLTLGCMCVYLPGRTVSSAGWSEPLAMACILIALFFLIRAQQRTQHALFLIAAAGILAGLAFATRYVLFLLVPVGMLFLFIQPGSLRRRIIRTLTFAVAASIPTMPVLAHNLATIGTILPGALPSDVSLMEAARTGLTNLFDSYLYDVDWASTPQLIGATLLGLLIVLLALRSRHPLRFFRAALFEKTHLLLTLWAVSYISLLIYWRSHAFSDELTGRLLFPGGVVVVILLAGLLVRASGMSRIVAALIALVMVLFAIEQQFRLTYTVPSYNVRRVIAASPRLQWLAENTNDDDLIIATDAVDIPFYLNRRYAISFSRYPYTNFITYDIVQGYACRHQVDFKRIFLVFKRVNREYWHDLLGPFTENLMLNRTDLYPGIRGPLVLGDALVFRVTCAA